MKWSCAGRDLDLSTPLIMGIVNVTPDSFSDGGEHASCEQAIEFGLKLLDDGADIWISAGSRQDLVRQR